ncbi:site-specific integrase [Gallionella capsiferriformans]|uniref:Integrase family protein n=1 Tax=Gallionella capsiferriformans (strain ES-2) TaxID=395494 RepID=D9SDF5_GALCS|nr:site-specific integrase [Gallionella capsiferriformans]ADL56753.1 integrase family protein [Gallionella capsiferriformans ES-2]
MSDTFKDLSAASSVPAMSESGRRIDEALRLFPLENLQYLDRESAIRCQTILGHGSRFGMWETPDAMIGRKQFRSSQCVDLRKRLKNFIPGATISTISLPSLDALLDEGVLWMTRYALLLRIGPSGMNKGNGRSLDVTMIATRLYAIVPQILAKGILRSLELDSREYEVFVRYLTSNAVRELNNIDKAIGVEFRRMRMLADQMLWRDALLKADISITTNPKGEAVMPAAQSISIPYPPIPDDYLAEMGPRILWLVRDLAPNLLSMFESIPELFSDILFIPGSNHKKAKAARLGPQLSQYNWRDRNGEAIIAPPFPLKLGRKLNGRDPYAWPPRYWENMSILAVTLQAAHLWVALLGMGGRISEISSLKRDCIDWARDGKPFANGKTFKLSANFAGTDRDWPAPEILVQALAQQARLVSAWERIARLVKGLSQEDNEMLVFDGEHLWASLGAGQNDPESQLMSFGQALQKLAERTGLTPKPGGKNLHPHRFRKTIARLVGIAIVDSPRVLMKLFGHKDIAMTLGYILTDKALQVEIDQVARELRIMRCQEVIEDMHTALHTPDASKFGGHGGGAAPFITEAVKTHEEELHRTGQLWDANSSYELSVILTGNGQYFRMTRPGVVCLKESREAGPCTCDSTCINRIEEKTARRDVRKVIPVLIDEGKRALVENQLLLVADKVQQINEEILRFDDIKEEFVNHPDVVLLREAVE